jgi:hypothetical protein
MGGVCGLHMELQGFITSDFRNHFSATTEKAVMRIVLSQICVWQSGGYKVAIQLLRLMRRQTDHIEMRFADEKRNMLSVRESIGMKEK